MRVGFLGLLTILFISLKLTGYIAWSWWWVLSPIWLPYVVIFGFMASASLASLALLSFLEWYNFRKSK